jgi:hypothetical protein
MVAVVDENGYRALEESVVEERFLALIESERRPHGPAEAPAPAARTARKGSRSK